MLETPEEEASVTDPTVEKLRKQVLDLRKENNNLQATICGKFISPHPKEKRNRLAICVGSPTDYVSDSDSISPSDYLITPSQRGD